MKRFPHVRGLNAASFLLAALLAGLGPGIPPAAARANIDTYSDAQHTIPATSFSGSANTVYAYGSGFNNQKKYSVSYYDGQNNIQSTDNNVTPVHRNLGSSYTLSSHPEAAPGTWHVVAYSTDKWLSPPSVYNPRDKFIEAQSSFIVADNAIPEFPDVLASLGVIGMCAAIYWLCKKKLALTV